MRITLKPGVLYQHLKDEDISRDELARRMGVSRATAYRVDDGLVDPSPRFIAAFITQTGKPFEELFDLVGEDVESAA